MILVYWKLVELNLILELCWCVTPHEFKEIRELWSQTVSNLSWKENSQDNAITYFLRFFLCLSRHGMEKAISPLEWIFPSIYLLYSLSYHQLIQLGKMWSFNCRMFTFSELLYSGQRSWENQQRAWFQLSVRVVHMDVLLESKGKRAVHSGLLTAC